MFLSGPVRLLSVCALIAGGALISTSHATAETLRDKSDTEALKDAAQTLLGERVQSIVTGVAPKTRTVGPVNPKVQISGAALADQQNKNNAIARQRSELASYDIAYTKATADVDLLDVTYTGSTARLDVSRNAALTYRNPPAPGITQLKTHDVYSLVFTKDAGIWSLQSQQRRADDGLILLADSTPDVSSAAPHKSDPRKKAAASTTRPAVASSKIRKLSGGYDYGAMARYATDHAPTAFYNPDYRSWSQDCTNFISQALRAGGWEDAYDPNDPHGNTSWWYTWTNQSASWINAEAFYWFAVDNRVTELGNVWDMLLGDVLQADWNTPDNVMDHTMMVHAFDYNGYPLIASHTNDASWIPLGQVISGNPGADWWAHRT
ncbi:amidase domain-containing protein [Embleya sp. NPDC020630]|uniref:amidase domain-containing protein n=1 Tax=Embleya sp. NPDC020630 TaxID=3363979 RepID=UPI0037BE1CDE